jgi:hypothetical protein
MKLFKLQKHAIPLSSIPCLQYARASQKEEEEQQQQQSLQQETREGVNGKTLYKFYILFVTNKILHI